MATPKPPMAKSSGTDHAAVHSALRTLDVEASGVAAISAALKSDLGTPFTAAAEMIRNAKGRLIVTGLGKSGHIGRKIAATFASTGTPAFFVHAAEASHGDLGMITADDVILAMSWSGEQPEMKNLINYAARFSIPLIAMTAHKASTLSKAADVQLTLPKAREACPHNLAPTTSSLMMLALGDALAIALLEGRGFTSTDFSVLHPGGKLGALLKYARDLMHTGDAVPLKPQGTKMSDALVEMTSKGFGCVGIVDARGHIIGIVTDGDLRRHMLRSDLMTASVDEIMTRNPKTVGRDTLAGEALEMLNAAKITALIVTDAKKPVGIIHLHDLLRAGVA
ncbi:SIS domain-containing protein [Bradyrhizobium erythrophlei]|uniref:KpsF/GutQ family sugar-phosphate isomerase n=1 Tax=Bradyrhizobium erythrophlei TaxID=1437360 RepID=UPI0035E644DA